MKLNNNNKELKRLVFSVGLNQILGETKEYLMIEGNNHLVWIKKINTFLNPKKDLLVLDLPTDWEFFINNMETDNTMKVDSLTIKDLFSIHNQQNKKGVEDGKSKKN